MTPGTRLFSNAADLDAALASQRSALGEISDDEERMRRAGAISQLETYVSLLRQAAMEDDRGDPMAPTFPFSFKLELEDGRWDVAEALLPRAPGVGDELDVQGRRWRVRAMQLVHASLPGRRPPREVFVVAPI